MKFVTDLLILITPCMFVAWIHSIYLVEDTFDSIEDTLDVMVCLDTNIFLFLLFIFLDLIFLFFWFFFSYYFDDKEAHDYSHMICHMIWSHRPRLWKKKLEEWHQSTCIQHSVLIEDMRIRYSRSMDNTWALG